MALSLEDIINITAHFMIRVLSNNGLDWMLITVLIQFFTFYSCLMLNM